MRKQVSGEEMQDFNLIEQNFFLLQAFGVYSESGNNNSYSKNLYFHLRNAQTPTFVETRFGLADPMHFYR